MANAKGIITEYGYIPEVTFGTTPASPALIELPVNTANFGKEISDIVSQEIKANRQTTDQRQGTYHVMASFEAEMAATDYDPFFESAFMSAIATNVLKIGSTFKHFSIEERMQDIAKYRLYKGLTVNKFTLSANPNEIVKLNFEMLGKEMVTSGTSADASLTAASSNLKMTALTGTISEGGSSIAIVTGFNLELNNGLAPTHVIGSKLTPELEYGWASVSGSLSAYFPDEALFTKFANDTSTTLELAITDGTSTYTFLVPKVKYSSHDLALSNEQSRIQELKFIGLYDATEATALKLTKS